MFDPLAPPYVRAQTYVDANPPAVLADEFYNPVQDSLARLYGAAAGYSASLSYEEFTRLVLTAVVPTIGDPFGDELAVLTNPGGGFTFLSSSPSSANQHGVYLVRGVASGNRGGGTGFQVVDGRRYAGMLRWIFRCRVRCSKFSVISTSPPGLVLGIGALTDSLPSWVADGTGFWTTFWDGGATTTAVPTTDGEWVTLWVAHRDGDGKVRWYLKRDTDPLPLLLDTQILTTKNLTSIRRYLRCLVTSGAVDLDNIEIDSISLGVER